MPITYKNKPIRASGEVFSIKDAELDVKCGLCDREYTHSEAKGGFLFFIKPVCPVCAIRAYKSIKRYKGLEYIRAICPENMTFRDFVMEIRARDIWSKVDFK